MSVVKRICICCDGTWNTPDKREDGRILATNVVRLAESIRARDAAGNPQLVFYDPGIGTRGNLLRRVYDGATGTGMSRNIREAYAYLVRNYTPGDALYLFGFSRGAFTVRSLAGLIRNSGLLHVDALDKLDDAYALYRSRAPEAHPRAREAVLFRRTYAVEAVTPIHLIGVWDTVGALGNPVQLNRAFDFFGRRNQFHDTDLSSTVRFAYHAVAIDETRRHFVATLWHQPIPVPGQTLEQVWFVGAHSNVGGGCATTGLSDIALSWMIDRVRRAELAVDPPALSPDPMERPEDSRRGPYRLIAPLHRPIKADDAAGTHEHVHTSVHEKYRRDAAYRPKNLLDYLAGPHGSEPPVE